MGDTRYIIIRNKKKIIHSLLQQDNPCNANSWRKAADTSVGVSLTWDVNYINDKKNRNELVSAKYTKLLNACVVKLLYCVETKFNPLKLITCAFNTVQPGRANIERWNSVKPIFTFIKGIQYYWPYHNVWWFRKIFC